jgi:hypothetical protein
MEARLPTSHTSSTAVQQHPFHPPPQHQQQQHHPPCWRCLMRHHTPCLLPHSYARHSWNTCWQRSSRCNSPSDCNRLTGT